MKFNPDVPPWKIPCKVRYVVLEVFEDTDVSCIMATPEVFCPRCFTEAGFMLRYNTSVFDMKNGVSSVKEVLCYEGDEG